MFECRLEVLRWISHLFSRYLRRSPLIRSSGALKDRQTERVRRHKKIWKLYRAGYRKEDIAQMVGIGSRSVYRALEHEQPPTRHRRHWTHHKADPYLLYLIKRWNDGCHTARAFYAEIVAQGYTGSLRAIERIVAHIRPQGANAVTKQMITFQKTPSPRNTALMIVRPQDFAHQRSNSVHRSALQE